MWYKLHNINRSAENEISADIHVPSDSPWFDGHFPGEPILPGVAQIGMVFEAIRKAQKQELKVSSVRRVRFKSIIRPDDRLKIIAAPLKQENGSYSFRILVQDETVCSGVMAVENQRKFKASIPEEEEID
ncbi:MAG: FabA/FabZ family ACP-dehydratase [Desulfobacterales bacterium]|jgi:3-hydroxyacyl-[acyl-carrier-protein] dehydratase